MSDRHVLISNSLGTIVPGGYRIVNRSLVPDGTRELTDLTHDELAAIGLARIYDSRHEGDLFAAEEAKS